MEEYHHCAVMIADRRGMLVRVFLCNLLQRAALITVTMFAFLSMGGAPGLALDVWALQCYTVLGSNCIPLPGAMGVSDYLLLDGFGAIGMSGVEATNLELLSRALSFYCCTLLCGLITWVCYCLKRKGKKNQ